MQSNKGYKMKKSIKLLQQLAWDFDFSQDTELAIWSLKPPGLTQWLRNVTIKLAPELQKCFWFSTGAALLGRRFSQLVILVDELDGLTNKERQYFEEAISLKLMPGAEVVMLGNYEP